MLAAAKIGRHSIGVEIDDDYADQAKARMEKAFGMFDKDLMVLHTARIPHEQTVTA